ncbi:hypothetical protein KP509_10G047500 [Ceratopteris richardii]|nr:hypothetical protein KP509_10G047500 [Ceratopteris richardii]
MISVGFSLNTVDLNRACISLFGHSSRLFDANLLFASLEDPNPLIWHAIISVHATVEEQRFALFIYFQMMEKGMKPNKSLHLCALKACSYPDALGHGRLIHSYLLRDGKESGVVVGTILLNFYAACGNFDDAQNIFTRLPNKNIVSWGAFIAGCAQHRKDHLALELYEEMQNMGLAPDADVLSSVLKACSGIKDLLQGLLIHDKVIRQSVEGNIVIGNTLIDMYAKCGDLVDAQQVFDTLPKKTAVTWSSMLAGYVSNGLGFHALDLFMKSHSNDICLNTFIGSSLIKSCGQLCDSEKGRILHSYLVDSGHEADSVVKNALIDMYFKCGCLSEAYTVFDSSCTRDVVAWGSLISGFVQAGSHNVALSLFGQMHQENRGGNSVTFSCALQACAGIRDLTKGRLIHYQVVVVGIEDDDTIGSTLVDMYAKCLCLMEAQKVFESLSIKTPISWGALIDGFASQDDHGHLAFGLFQKMKDELSLPNMVLFSSVLKACCKSGSVQEGRLIHSQMICSGSQFDLVAGNSLLDMYIKTGSIEDAHKVFDELINRDITTWACLISGYTELCNYTSAIELFRDMQKVGIGPNKITILCALKACGGAGSLEQGRLLHATLCLSEVEVDLAVENALIDMYSRCGSMEDAQIVFSVLHELDLISWGTIIDGYALQGSIDMVGHYSNNMRMQGIMMDEGVFSSVLSVCRQVGHVPEARRFFLNMKENHQVTTNATHLNCMVDLIARTGQLYDAENLLANMPVEADAICWMSLLTSCKIYGNVQLGRRCFEKAVLIEPECAASYILMWGIYADAEQWDEMEKIIQMRQLTQVSWTGETCEDVLS